MSRGRPFERGNKCGQGRPKGTPNKKTLEAQALFERNSAAIMALAINSSREDRQMLRMLASRIVARMRESPVPIGRLPMSTLADLDRASEVTLQHATVSSGGRYCRTREQPFPRNIGHFPQVPGTAPLTKRTESSSQVHLARQTEFELPTSW